MSVEPFCPGADRIGEPVGARPFSNGTSFDIWYSEWCENCWHDRKATREDKPEEGCPWLAMAIGGLEVDGWVYNDRPYPGHVTCLGFTPDDGGPDDGPPVPQPVPPGQTVLVDPREFDWDRVPQEVSR